MVTEFIKSKFNQSRGSWGMIRRTNRDSIFTYYHWEVNYVSVHFSLVSTFSILYSASPPQTSLILLELYCFVTDLSRISGWISILSILSINSWMMNFSRVSFQLSHSTQYTHSPHSCEHNWEKIREKIFELKTGINTLKS